jgi:hypothetical protein
MLKHSVVFSNDNILSTISKTIHDISVFIQPSSIVSPIKDIEDLKLICNEDDLNSEKLMIEFYSDEDNARKRVEQFNGKYKDYYYVSMWNAGEFICSNVEEEN